jgi:hypothetical protein
VQLLWPARPAQSAKHGEFAIELCAFLRYLDTSIFR